MTNEATSAILARLDAIEARLAALEQRLGMRAETPSRIEPKASPAVDGPVRQPDANAPPPRPRYGAQPAAGPSLEPAPSAGATSDALRPLREWLAGGNTLTRVGIVILFFGVAFLLRYFAEIADVPIEAKLAGAALGGLALAGLGMRLARARPAYGLSLQGAGMGIVYLTVFAAFRLYDALPAWPAIALLAGVALATIGLALAHDSQALAALAFAGGFAAPMLIDTGQHEPALLFAWFAVLNGALFAIAWRRSWRALVVLGFVFTFALGLAWGWHFYRPRHYGTVQPFLALFFLFYVGIAVLHARRAPLDARAPVDGVLVFGVPLVGFALQAGIVRSFRYGEAWSAVALAAFYGALWLWLRGRAEPGLPRLAKAFGALAIVFATLALPFALEARWTSAGWAIEAAAVYWLGVVQRQRLARAFALVVALAAAAAYLWSWPEADGTFVASAAFFGAMLIGVGALAIVYVADRHVDAVGVIERKLMTFVLAWGIAWTLLAGVREVDARFAGALAINAALAWSIGIAALALAASRLLHWPRIAWAFMLVLPALVVAGMMLFDEERTTLVAAGWIVWPLAWAVQVAGLRFVEDAAAQGTPTQRASWTDWHVATAVAFVAWIAWEASEWTGRVTPRGSVWIACAAALPAVAYLAAVTRWRFASFWPLRDRAEAYGRRAGVLVAAAVGVWFVGVNAISPGDTRPWPFVPLANPLDVTLALALFVLWHWSAAWARASAAQRGTALGVMAFVAVNGALVRTAHHWGHVPWRFDALFHYRPLQAALTLGWTACALALMVLARRRGAREVWLAGAALLALVVAKLFLLDLAALSGLTRVVAFLGVGALLLVIGYVAPLPPARDEHVAS